MVLRHNREIQTAFFLYLTILALKVPFIYHRLFPILFYDEAAYIYKARNIAEYCRYFLPRNLEDIPVFYAPVYSIILSPVLSVFHTPEVSYKAILLLNAVITSTIIFPLYFLSADFCPKYRVWISLAAGTLASCFGYSFAALSEAVFVPLITFSLYFYYRRLKTGQRKYHIFFWVSWALLPLVRNAGIVLLPAYVFHLAVSWIFLRRREEQNQRELATDTGALAAATMLYLIWTVFAKSYGTEFQTFSSYLKESVFLIFQSIPSFIKYVRIWVGQAGYLFLGTYTLGIFSLSYLKPAPPGASHQIIRQRHFARLLFTSVFFLNAAATIHMFAAWNIEYRPRYLMYGRYMDPLVPLIFFLGISCYAEKRIIEFVHLAPSKAFTTGILFIFSTYLFLLNIPEEIESIRILNMGVAGVDGIMTGFHYGSALVFLAAVFMLGTVFIPKRFRMALMIPLVLALNAFTISRVYQGALTYDKQNISLLNQIQAIQLAPGAKVWLVKREMDDVLWWKYKYYFHTRAQSIRLLDEIDYAIDYVAWGAGITKASECKALLEKRLQELGYKKKAEKSAFSPTQ